MYQDPTNQRAVLGAWRSARAARGPRDGFSRRVARAMALVVLVGGTGVSVAQAQSGSPEGTRPSGGAVSAPSLGAPQSSQVARPRPSASSGAAVGPSAEQPAHPSTTAAPLPAPSTQAPRNVETLQAALGTPGDLTLRNSTLSGALFTIGELWGINIVSGKLEGNVNGVFKRAPLREILDSILLSNGYGYRAVGESLVVTELNRLGQVNPFFESATVPVRVADVNDAVAGARLLTTPQGKVQAIPSARSLFVLDFPDRVRMIQKFIQSLDATASGVATGGDGPGTGAAIGPRRLEVAYVKAQYVPVKSVSDAVSAVLSPLGKVTTLEAEDRLLIVDLPENLAIAQRVIQQIDRPRPQVSIKSLIYDLSLTDIEQLGVNWSSITNGTLSDLEIGSGGNFTGTNTPNSGAGTVFNSFTAAPIAAGSPGGAFTLTQLGSKISLAAIALMLQQADDSRLLASPAVTVAENERAIIESVTEIPFQQLQQTAAGGAIGTTAFKQAGITLSVQPKIAHDLTVDMIVRPEFSLLTGFTPGDNQPIIDRRTAETTVRVANGSTLVIGGMRQRSDVGSIAGIPFLKDIRVLGHLFRSRQTNIRESELVVFITPTIVGYDTPPSERDQRGAETVRCQLAAIPPASGCVEGDGGADGFCTDGLSDGCSDCAESTSTPHDVPPTPVLAPPRGAPTATPPSPTARPSVPVPQPLASAPESIAAKSTMSKPTSIALRRLPPISGVSGAAVAERPTDKSRSARRWRLR